MPLGTQQASDIIATGDPMWCPAGTTTIGASCVNAGTVAALIPLLAGKTGAGVVYFTSTYSTNDVTFSSANASLAGLTDLTLQGGWDGVTSGTIHFSGSTTFSVPVTITGTPGIGWTGNVTLNDIVITGLAATSTALSITNNKNITLNRVSVHNNSGGTTIGAALTNTNGTGTITVNSSGFNSNATDGLDASSKGLITLTDVLASNNVAGFGVNLNDTSGTAAVVINGGIFQSNALNNINVIAHGAITLTNVVSLGSFNNGALLNNSGASIAVPVTVTGNNVFNPIAGEFNNTFFNNGNSIGEAGLAVLSKGQITLTDIYAYGNSGYGASLDNHTGTANVVLTTSAGSTNAFYANGYEGLKIITAGSVTSSNLLANSNGNLYTGGGAQIDNSTAASALPVTLSGSNQFQYNNTFGLSVLSKGTITLNSVIADRNLGTYAMNVQNSGVLLVNAGGTGGVTLTGTNEFNYNSNNGLMISSRGAVTLNNITANNNGSSGHGYAVLVDNSTAGTPMTVSLTGTNTMENNDQGLNIDSKGAITVNNLTSEFNYTGTAGVKQDGVVLTNSNAGAVGGVTLAGTNVIQSNYYGNGLFVTSYGAITLNNVDAEGNGFYNSALGYYGHGILLDNSGSSLVSPPGVTLAGTNVASGNGYSGLFIRTKGAVSISNLTAASNGSSFAPGNGADIDNTAGKAGVSLTGANVFQYNYMTGLLIATRGAITLSSITAYGDSHGAGADLNNSTASPAQNVTISGTSDFSNNGPLGGLVIQTLGAITLNNISGSSANSGSNAVSLDNSGGTLKNISMTGTNTFYSNTGEGLYVNSSGAITINSLAVTWSGTLGAELHAVGTVTLTGTNNVSYNVHNIGLEITSSAGAIKINSLTAQNNGDGVNEVGVYLDNSPAGASQPIIFTGTSSANDNYDSGIYIKTMGAITINSLTADSNGTGASTHAYGLEIPVGSASVSLTGTNDFSYNYSGGLWVTSSGAITLNSVSASGNYYGDGAHLDNTTGTAGVTILGTGNAFDGNLRGAGLEILTKGPISLTSINAGYNGSAVPTNGYGAILDNTAGTLQNVILSGTNTFGGNYQDGLRVNSSGGITLNQVTADGNHQMGVHLTAVGAVSLTGSNEQNYNTHTGLNIITTGPIAVNSLNNNGNGSAPLDYGIFLDNHTGSGAPVTLTGSSTVSEDSFDSNARILSAGLVTIGQLTSQSAGNVSGSGYGLVVDNTSGTAGVKILGPATSYLQYNRSGGLFINSNGPISLNNIVAGSNWGNGATLTNNHDSAHPQDVTLTGTNAFSYNTGGTGGSGLVVQTFGAISLNNVTADNNSNSGDYGAVLDNWTGSVTPKAVSLSGINDFSGNSAGGLAVTASGAISIGTLTASGNSLGEGAHLDNSSGTGGVSITVKATLASNHGPNLDVTTLGGITIANLDVESSATGNGATLVNTGGTAGVTLTGTNKAISNHGTGLWVATHGAVSMAGVQASYNGYSGGGTYGVEIDNRTGSVVAEPVSLTGTNKFAQNQDSGGLFILSLGAISLQNTTAVSNTGPGVILNNQSGTAGVSVSGTNVFSSNTGQGLQVTTKGAVALSSITADSNSGLSGIGVDINNTSGTAGVTLTGTNAFSFNAEVGLRIYTNGAITLNNLTADYNSSDGVLLDNHTGSGAITLTGLNTFIHNYAGTGLNINAAGAVTVDKIRSEGNGGDGLHITTLTSAAVNVVCGYITANNGIGVNISDPTPSLVTLTGVLSMGNSGGDYNPATGMNRVGACTLP